MLIRTVSLDAMKVFQTLAVLSAAAISMTASGQMHRVAKKDTVTRAVGVYEWTGDDIKKPGPSRLIPVSLFVDGDFQDAGLYLARPVPLALNTDIVYELQDAGEPKGLIALDYARNLKPGDGMPTLFDQGWTGYGKWQPLPVPKVKTPQKVELASTDKEDDRPKLGRGKKDSKDQKDTKKDKNTPKDQSGVTPVDTNPEDDADRPTLKKRTEKEKRDAIKNDTASVQDVGNLNDDPDRPKIMRGKPAKEMQALQMSGMPANMHQMVAVSDATMRDVHDFNYHFRDPQEKAEILAKLEKVAISLVTPPAAPPPPIKTGGTSRSTGARSKLKAAPVADVPPVKLVEEKFSAYELSYNSAPVFVLEGHTGGDSSPIQYVTVVAQNDTFGEPQVAIKTATDVAHMDSTPWMRLVGVVDAEASNRASLLMELRGQQSRSFALYRLISAQATKTFETGTVR